MPRPPLNLMIRHLRRWSSLKDADALSDGQLLERFLTQRDESAFTVLVRRYAPLVWDVCRGLLSSEADAEDAFQAVFLVLVRRAPSLDRKRPLSPWLAEVARRTALKALQRNRLPRERQPLEHPTIPSSAEEASQREMRRLVHEEVHRLPERDRLPIVLCWLQGWTHEKAARELGLPRGSMAKRLAAAQDRLRRRLLDRGVTLALTGLAAGLTEPCPQTLQAATVQTALQWTVGDAAVGLLSTSAASLAKGVLQAMTFQKVRMGLAVMLAIGVIGVGSVAIWSQAQEVRPLPTAPTESETSPLLVAGATPPPAGDVAGSRSAVPVPNTSRNARKLNSPVDFKGYPPDPKATLQEALEFLQDRYDLIFDVHELAFKQADRESSDVLAQPIAEREIPKMRGVLLSTVLERVLSRLKTPAAYRVCGDRIVIIPKKYMDLQELFDEPDLKPRVTAEINKQPLKEALEELTNISGVAVVIDSREMEKTGQMPVSATLGNVPIDDAVRMLADMADLKPVIMEGAIYITSKPNAIALQQEEDKRRKEKLERAKVASPPTPQDEPKMNPNKQP